MKHVPKKLKDSSDHSQDLPPTEIMRSINEQFNNRLAQARSQRRVIRHSGEAGQAAENVFRDLLRQTLPMRYGVAKGKIVNSDGEATRHLDVIIYDALHHPALFIDDNSNQILPIESVYAVIEVKLTLTKSALIEAFNELASIKKIHLQNVCSTNKLVDHRPPLLSIFAFHDERTLDTLHKNYCELSKNHPVRYSASNFSMESPGFKDMRTETYMVHDITIANKGTVFHMLNNSTAIGRWGHSTFGLFISSKISTLSQIKLDSYHPTSYLSWLNAGRRDIFD